MTDIERTTKSAFMRICHLVPVVAFSCVASAQDFKEIALKYKNELAVITNVKEQLVVTNRNGKLEAVSTVSKEKILTGELSPGLLNTEYIYHSYFNRLVEHDEEVMIPSKNGYKEIRSSSTKTVSSEQNNIFYDDSKQTEVSFSGLAQGALMRTEYTLSHTDVHMLPAYYFHTNYPVIQSTYEVTTPKNVNMKFVIKGSDADKVVQNKQENKNTITYTFTASNLPAHKGYDDAPSVAWHALHIVPFITSYQQPGQAAPTELLSDPAHLYTYFYDFVRHINIKEDVAIAAKVQELTKADNSAKEKAAHIYQWVQQSIFYIAFEDSLEGFIPRQAADIYQRKFGDCKDMASILVAMCRKAGIPAYFTWIGTRSKPYTFTETPVPMVANHMICTINIGDEWIFLDATHSLIPFDVVPSSLQGKQALISLDKDNFKIIDIPETIAAHNSVLDSTTLQINDKNVSGKLTIDYSGYPSWDLQTMLMYNKNKDRDQLVRQVSSRGSNKYVQNNYQFTKSDAGKKDCRLAVDFTIGDYVQKVNNEYYVNMNVKRYLESYSIDTQGRSIPYYYSYRDVHSEVVTLQIPPGFHVSFLPPESKGNVENLWNYSLKYKIEGSHVVLTKDFQFQVMSIPKQYFVQHNQLIESLKKQYKETIILTAD